MKSMLRLMMLGVLFLVLTACTQVNAKKSLTAEDVFEKAEEASDKLESAKAHIVIEDLSAPTDPEQKKITKYDIQSIFTAKPDVLNQKVHISQSKMEPWDVELYRLENRIFGKEDPKQEWDELPANSLSEMFGPLYQYINPKMDLSLFDDFKNEFELEPVDYGYALTLSMTKDQFKQFSKKLFGSESGVFQEDGKSFLLAERMDFQIVIDRNTWFVTDFKMLTDTTTYVGRDAHRLRKKVNVTYSYFNDIDEIQVPAKIKD